MIQKKLVVLGLVAATGLGAAACGSEEEAKDGIALDAVTADGKSDLGRSAKVIDAVGPQSTITGEFNPRVRVYAYVVEANAGAKLDISLDAKAGDDALDLQEDGALDTVLAVYGPYADRQNPGPLLVESEDGDESLAAPPVSFEVEQDGRYLVAFSSYNDTGTGKYTLNLGCEGTDFQCRRANLDDKECKEGQLFVQGGQVTEDTVWESCEVVLLEPTTVAAEATLTIDPGVTVKGNFLSGQSGAGNFGDVNLNVLGTIQAVGTKDHPIRFTSLTENGWGGIVLSGQSNSIEHAFIDNASVAITLNEDSTGEITDVVLDGELHLDDGASVNGQAGIRGMTNSQAVFKRALVHGYQNGLHANQSQLIEIEDSVIRNNGNGVFIQGEGGRITRCQNPPAVNVWRDPVIRYSDIHHNQMGIRIDGSDALLKIEYSNIVDNESHALAVYGTQLNEESFLRNNNIVRNNSGEMQVRTYHRQGQIDISMNYWEDISDPELSANWRLDCQGTIDFSGFHPEPVADAGPREEALRDEVKQEKLDVQQDVLQGGGE